MNKICAILFTMLFISGTIPENSVEAKIIKSVDTIDTTPIQVDTMVDKIQTLDSLFLELKNRNHEKNFK